MPYTVRQGVCPGGFRVTAGAAFVLRGTAWAKDRPHKQATPFPHTDGIISASFARLCPATFYEKKTFFFFIKRVLFEKSAPISKQRLLSKRNAYEKQIRTDIRPEMGARNAGRQLHLLQSDVWSDGRNRCKGR